MKDYTDSFFEDEHLSLEELHKRAYASIDKFEDFNYGENEDIHNNDEDEEYSIEREIKNPYDYGSDEFNSAMERILANRAKYRKDKLAEQQLYKLHKQKER